MDYIYGITASAFLTFTFGLLLGTVYGYHVGYQNGFTDYPFIKRIDDRIPFTKDLK